MKLRRFLRILLLSPIILLALVVFWGLLDAREGASAVTVWNYTWPGVSGGTRGGYLMTPQEAQRRVPAGTSSAETRARRSSDGRYPAVLLLHEWWGLNLETARMAEYLAADGYIVLAPDLLRGQLSVTVPGALFSTLTTRRPRIIEDADLAFRQLASIPQVDPERIAVVGFCFGGTEAMRMGARTESPAVIGIFYGNDPITDDTELGFLGADAPVFGAYGGEDRMIPRDDVESFRSLLDARAQPVDITIYDGVGHAFVNPQGLRTDTTAIDAWNRLRRFLVEHL